MLQPCLRIAVGVKSKHVKAEVLNGVQCPPEASSVPAAVTGEIPGSDASVEVRPPVPPTSPGVGAPRERLSSLLYTFSTVSKSLCR